MNSRSESRWTTALPVLAGSAALVACIVVFFPGWLSYDSSFQFWQARTGEFSNLSPVVMSALWRVVYMIWPSPAAMLILHLVAYWTGIVLLGLQLCRHAFARVAFVLGIGLLPPAMLILAHLWTDASLIAAMTLAFGLTVTGLRRLRALPLALALPVILYAGAVRHNSLLAIIPLCLLWAQACLRVYAGTRPAAAKTSRSAVAVGIALLVVLGSFTVGRTLDHLLARERVSTWAIGALWDLAGISLQTGTLVVPDLARTEGTDLASLREKYSPYVGVPLFEGAGRIRHGLGDEVFSSDELALLRRAWLAAVVAHPLSFARHRLAVTTRLFGPYRSHPEGLFFTPTVVPYRDNPPAEAALLGVRDTLVEQIRRTRGWLMFTPALYLVFAAVAAAWGWQRRRDPFGQIALAFAGSGLLLVLPLTVFAPSAELRYCGWLFTSSLVAFIACGATRRSVHRRDR